MVIRFRGEFTHATEQVNLTVQFRDQFGNPVDTDTYPSVSIIQPSGDILLYPTTVGVSNVGIGKYSYIFTAPINGPYGIYNDYWVGNVSSVRKEFTLSFVVSYTQFPELVNSDGYVSLGDDVGYNYSQTAILNINKCLKLLKSRLNSSGKVKSKDQYGNVIYVDCDIFSIDMLVNFLVLALSNFNSIPYFTRYTWDDTDIIDLFMEHLVQGATLYALASQALIERGREISVSDSGISYQIPTISELLNTQYSTLLTSYNEQIKYIKNSMRPSSLGLGTLRTTGNNPAMLRLRHLRARRLI